MATTQTKNDATPPIEAAFEQFKDFNEQVIGTAAQSRQPVPRFLREGRRPCD